LEEKLRKRGETAARLQKDKRKEREAILLEQKNELQKDIKASRKKADDIGLASILYEADRIRTEQTEQVIKSLLAERERLELEGQSTAQRVSVEVEATAPRVKNWKKAVALAAGVGLVFFLAGALGIASWDRRAGRIRSHAEVVHGLGLRVIGSLPLLGRDNPADRLKQPAKLTYQGHVWIESINGIRTVLLYEAGRNKLKTVMVTSAGPLEGKTTLTSHLAISLAGAGCRTLLIDADMRRPVLHRLFERKLTPGLGDVLSGRASLAEAVQPTDMPGLWLLPAGSFDEVVSGLLARGQMKLLLETLRAEYESIVVDSPPIMPVNDALLIGQHVDAVVLSVRPEQSRVPIVNEACDRLWALNIPVLGTVLNGMRSGPQYYSNQYVASSEA
jgi:capsular exopolysaccharide synthesis family protein